MIVAPVASDLFELRNTKRFNKSFLIISGLILVSVLSFSWLQKGKFSRERPTMHDVYKIGEVVPKYSTIMVPHEMYDEEDFILQGFLVRYFNISIDPYEKHQFFLVEKALEVAIPEQFEKIELDLKKYNLYRQL